MTLVANGELWTHNEGDIMFSIPAFTSAQQAIRCGYDKIATSQHEINARVEVLKRLRALENAVEEEQTLLTGKRMNLNAATGLVRNIHVLNYSAVDEAMGFDPAVRSYPYGGVPKPAKTKIELTPDQKNDLRLLLCVANSSVDKRQRDRVVMYILPNAQIENFNIPPGLNSPTLENSRFRGFPSFNVSVSSIDGIDRGSCSIVPEMMKFACCVTSRFCTDKDAVEKTQIGCESMHKLAEQA